MANILRYNPADDTFDDLFRGFFMRPVRFEGGQDVQIKLDVKEDSKGYTVHADIPGVKKEDINVTIDGNQVLISAEVKSTKEIKEGEKVIRSERHYGKTSRSFALGQDVDDTAAEAKYTDGVLTLQLPKLTSSRSKNLTIR
ncbi:MAG: Hsp20/alpha crystallin family protein [Betaproteobacteria bacterium]